MQERMVGRAAVVLLFVTSASAQDPNDGGYIAEHTPTKRVVPYPHIREADVLW